MQPGTSLPTARIAGAMVDVKRFRYVARNGVGMLSTHQSAHFKRVSRAKILHSWMTFNGPNYCAEAVSEATIRYLHKVCDPRDRRIFFEEEDIA